ncbi:dienelactone hydrolase family protein [Metabacillus litoralis]|uniref:dienelactone hydrolase family protein n=1 Tax=Metabacillus litoralis TaxID=152268 RepID=UPI001CFDB490|nr:dienelactone hydrolase family protein [Metabacillus litoralis]
MINIGNDSAKTLIIVVHEIYGINKHIKHFCQSLSKLNVDIICPNLLDMKTAFKYEEEQKAYEYFKEHKGFEYGFNQIIELIKQNRKYYDEIFVLGFSVGATIAWMCSEEELVDGVVGYYGTRIRDYLHRKPTCPVLLFFPEQESSFNVEKLIKRLKDKKVNIHQLKGKHGCCDPYSENYQRDSSVKAYFETVNFFKSF